MESNKIILVLLLVSTFVLDLIKKNLFELQK